ncbi:hypothetical protein ACUY3K_01950 [Corynebacterium uberis]|uniref:hypothetical protein n=1 Tax=Corynebacterium TaxID=1716 RepID=UPI001D09F80A|nr:MULTISPECIES: hypothetical protein [Corynebacterium]MCZ9308666.1 hypothetical protein [Corynebacterium sp. c6VSa_13]UDL74305.1 hypothetical protein LH391_03625 [Corynebacterium uberis]UDL76862.1 hypothetical protein LH393_05775 [Corynebacterium uberis]UDL79075.1 hypothetical protein LH394_05765 [Corynebacterium uberis]UDL79313.1 hypothetical protein LH392_06180 [Corynebacterium uberis]
MSIQGSQKPSESSTTTPAQRTTRSPRRRSLLLAVGAVAVVGAATTGLAWACADSADTPAAGESHSEQHPVTVRISGLLKPSAVLTVTADCGSDTRAEAQASFGAHTQLTPAADAGVLIGDLIAPVNIGPGPADGYHTLTVTCESGDTTTVVLSDDGNGTAHTRSLH